MIILEIKVNDYVRFDGEIAKIIDIKRYKTKEDIYVFDKILDLNEDRSCNDNTIYNSQWKYFDNVKSSPRIIDLIEVGDYVNGVRVGYIDDCKGAMREYYYNFEDEQRDIGHYEEDIKSVLTKEMFEQMEYKIND